MSERMTVIVSALAALAILGLGVTAQQTGGRLQNRTEALESDLRFQLEMTWRHDGRTREARLATLDETLAAWQKSPQTPTDRQLLEAWLQRSIASSLPGESGAFPPTPVFGADANHANDGAPAGGGESIRADTTAGPRDVELWPGQAYTPPRAKEIHLTPRGLAAEQAVVPPPRRVMAAKPVAPVKEAAVVETEVAAAPARAEEIEAKTPTVAEVGQTYQGVETQPGDAVGEPLVVEEEVSEAEIAGARRTGSPVMVNLAELNAQIRGYHVGLDEIEATIVRERGKLKLGHVAKLVGELELLAGQHQFVRLYYDGLSDRERRFVNEPRSMGDTIALVEGQRAMLVEEEGDFLTTLEADAEEDELQRRLKAVAAAVGASAEQKR